MKILSAKQLQKADAFTIKKQNISSDELMERAGSQIFQILKKNLENGSQSIKIFSGIGNNGGDGLVIGRLLTEAGFQVTVYIVNYSHKRSKNFLANYDRIKNVNNNWPILLGPDDDFPQLDASDLVIDAIFGIGINRPVPQWVSRLIRYINTSETFVLSIDIPSGMFPDQATKDTKSIVQATQTLSFQTPKMAFFLPETGEYVGELGIINIGLDLEFINNIDSRAQLIGKLEARQFYNPRKTFSHKGTFGHALLIGGSYGKMGSISLAATACMRAGAGLVTVFIPASGYEILQHSIPEAMVLTDENEKEISKIHYDFEPSVICFGVGVGQLEETKSAFSTLLETAKQPMLIDADGLNLLSANPELMEKVPKGSVLTPHPGELERLIGSWKNDFEKLQKAQDFSSKYQVVLLIKGAYTLTIFEENVYINNSGNAGMATGGSGDVLSGVISGLISQKYSTLSAAVFGVYLHGKAGDLAVVRPGFPGMIAGDIPKKLGAAYADLFETKQEN